MTWPDQFPDLSAIQLARDEFDWRVQRAYPLSESGYFQYLKNAKEDLPFIFHKTVGKNTKN